MTENLKPTSKVIQISTDILKIQDGVIGFTTTKLCTQITALCDDGSIWLTNNMEKALGESWYCILEAPKPNENAISELHKLGILEVKNGRNFINFEKLESYAK